MLSLRKIMTIDDLKIEAKNFSEILSSELHNKLYGVNDGKKIGTYMEHMFQNYLFKKYELEIGNSASGIDFPSPDIITDIKVTSIKQPQSSCPYKSSRQKIYGLGYNLIIFVYEKLDIYENQAAQLKIKYCTFVEKERTGDYTLTKMLLELLKNGANKEDIIGQFYNVNLPGEEIEYEALSQEVMKNPPKQGYLTISNALQWRLQYQRVINLANTVQGVTNYIWKH
jgi:hypothetical protein